LIKIFKNIATAIAAILLVVQLAGAEQKTPEQLQRDMLLQRATQAVFWGMPAASMMALRRGIERDLGADFHDIVYMSQPMVARHEFLTANNQTPYVVSMLDMTGGPVVVEVPAASSKAVFFGSANDAWMVPVVDFGPQGEDAGKGGKYLFLPPNYDKPAPEDYLVNRPATYHVYVALRPVAIGEGSMNDAVEYSKRLKVYPLAEAANPTPNKYIDAYPRAWKTTPEYDLDFFRDIARVVAEEPVQPKDKVMTGMLASLGIVKGRPFAPEQAMQDLLNEGAGLAGDMLQASFLTPGIPTVPFWPGRQWGMFNLKADIPKGGFSFTDEQRVLIDERAHTFYWLTFPPKKMGKGSFYLVSMRDGAGAALDGNSSYRLHMPANAPVSQFWSITAYSISSKSFIAGPPRVGLSSYDKESLKFNMDGSIDLYFAPAAAIVPDNMVSNWLGTSDDFFLMVRFYGPQPALFEKTWKMPDLELLQ
jgi:hypothetical protein